MWPGLAPHVARLKVKTGCICAAAVLHPVARVMSTSWQCCNAVRCVPQAVAAPVAVLAWLAVVMVVVLWLPERGVVKLTVLRAASLFKKNNACLLALLCCCYCCVA